ncbi:MAG: ATP-binding protein [Nitrospirota bacterium]
MIGRRILEEIIVSNEEFILKQIGKIVDREGIFFPEILNKTVVFYGVRRSGKTFILYALFKKYRDYSLYIDFEDERLLGFELKDFESLKDVMLELRPHLIGKDLVFLLDEVQNIEGWERFCRRAVERENIRVYVSGSSSKMMPSEIHTELRGRAWSIEVLPFSFREYLHAKDIDLSDKGLIYGSKKALVKKYFSEYMKWGGFPEVSFLELEIEKTKLIKEYFSAMYFRDLVERYNITNIPLLENLTDKLFSSFSLKFSLTSFYKQYKDRFPFSKDLLFRYYKHFLQSMLVFEVRKFAESVYKRMRNPAKVYLVDTGLCRRITSADAGRLLENIVFLEMRRRGYEVFYFEEKKECDFIAKTENNKLFPIQVSFELNQENSEREIGGLIEACRWLGTNEGMILTYDGEKDVSENGINIKVFPIWKWSLQH